MMIPQQPRRGGRRRGSVMAEINIVPFTDVVLVLMIIMMIGAVAGAAGMHVNLPAASTAEPIRDRQDVKVVVQAEGDVLLNDHVIAVADLAGRLKAMDEQQPVAVVFLAADRDVSWERVVAVMDASKQAGLTHIQPLTQLPMPANGR